MKFTLFAYAAAIAAIASVNAAPLLRKRDACALQTKRISLVGPLGNEGTRIEQFKDSNGAVGPEQIGWWPKKPDSRSVYMANLLQALSSAGLPQYTLQLSDDPGSFLSVDDIYLTPSANGTVAFEIDCASCNDEAGRNQLLGRDCTMKPSAGTCVTFTGPWNRVTVSDCQNPMVAGSPQSLNIYAA